MTIDLCFTDENLRRCTEARCKDYRNRIARFRYTVPNGGEDELAPYRNREPNDEEKEDVPGSSDAKVRTVRFSALPRELQEKWLSAIRDEDRISEWDELPLEEQREICEYCPIRQENEDNCYVRFLGYPELARFKYGFALTLRFLKHLSETVPDEKVAQVKDIVLHLYGLCRGTPVWRFPEFSFNLTMEVLSETPGIKEVSAPGFTKVPGLTDRMVTDLEVKDLLSFLGEDPDPIVRIEMPDGKIMEKVLSDTAVIPFVDEFISMFVYCRKPADEPATVAYCIIQLRSVARLAKDALKDDKANVMFSDFADKMRVLAGMWLTAGKYNLKVECIA